MFSKKISRAADAVVTGAGSGIGRAFAFELARRGGRVVCADINLKSARQTARELGDAGHAAWGVACDVRDLAAVETLADESEALLGGTPSLVINNAGIGTGGRTIGDASMDDWHATLDVNLWGVIHGCHVFVPRLRTRGAGGVLNVASTASFAAAPTMGPYNVSKAGVLALTETLAAELPASRFRVSALCPTFVKTNIMRDGRIDAASSRMAARLMDWTGVPAERIARVALDGLDRGELHVVPQVDARLVWMMKRYAPSGYTRGARLVGSVMQRMQRA